MFGLVVNVLNAIRQYKHGVVYNVSNDKHMEDLLSFSELLFATG